MILLIASLFYFQLRRAVCCEHPGPLAPHLDLAWRPQLLHRGAGDCIGLHGSERDPHDVYGPGAHKPDHR